MWHSRLGLALCDEYTRRYGKEHKSHAYHRWLNRHIPPVFEGAIENPVGTTPFAVCMPDECKVQGDPIESYKQYYRVYKRSMAKWKILQPAWYDI
jgi:hypothetical protein